MTEEGNRKTRVTTYKSMLSNLVNGSRGSSTLVGEEKDLDMSADSITESEHTKYSGDFNVFRSQFTKD